MKKKADNHSPASYLTFAKEIPMQMLISEPGPLPHHFIAQGIWVKRLFHITNNGE